MKCKQIKQDGKQCEAEATSGSDFCYWHNPENADNRIEASRSGGKNNLIKIAEPLPEIQVNEASDVVGLLQDTINRVRAGKLDIRVANCIGVLSGQLIKAIEMANTNQRISVIEKVVLRQE